MGQSLLSLEHFAHRRDRLPRLPHPRAVAQPFAGAKNFFAAQFWLRYCWIFVVIGANYLHGPQGIHGVRGGPRRVGAEGARSTDVDRRHGVEVGGGDVENWGFME